MTIEEKAKRYDEAKLRMSAAYNSNRCTIGFMNEIFPELKESDDKKIMKDIVTYLKSVIANKGYRDKIIESWIAWLEKQGEQKPNYCHHEVDLSGCAEEYRKAYYDGWNNCNQQHAQLEAEQKPAWSEEDEEMLKDIITSMTNLKDSATSDALRWIYDSKINWLKFLKERYTWKPSDEQMEALEHFVRSVGESGYASPYDNNTKLLYSLLSDLKKLKG